MSQYVSSSSTTAYLYPDGQFQQAEHPRRQQPPFRFSAASSRPHPPNLSHQESEVRGAGVSTEMGDVYHEEGSIAGRAAQFTASYERNGTFRSSESPIPRKEPSGYVGDSMSSPTRQFAFRHHTRHLQPERGDQHSQHIAATEHYFVLR
ncbi:hypothetical protein BT69DRAFT_1333076 [Atractiella rhizophila]|nr:hypothetical protein BT69DRAFT_1333076 [Atractiella rhizophila]